MTRARLVQHSLLKNQTLWPKMRGPVEGGGVGEEQERETPRGKTRGVPGAGSHLPSREDASCVSQVLALDTPDFRMDSFSPCAPC